MFLCFPFIPVPLFFGVCVLLANAATPQSLRREERKLSDHIGRTAIQAELGDVADPHGLLQISFNASGSNRFSSLIGTATAAETHEIFKLNTLANLLGMPRHGWIVAALLLVGGLSICYCQSRAGIDIFDSAFSSDQEASGWANQFILLRNLWPIVFIGGLAYGISMPLEDYVSLNFFAQKYANLRPELIHCEITPDLDYCKKAVNDNVEWKSITGVMAAAIQLCLGPAIGMISDAYGRQPVIVTINIIHLVPAIAQALFVYFNVSLYLWYALFIFAVVPDLAVWLALITDLIENPQNRASAFGLTVVAWQLSVLLGMAVGSTMPLPAAIAAALLFKVANIAYMFFGLSETLPSERRKPLSSGVLRQGGGLLILFRSWQLRSVTFVFIISQFVNDGLAKVGNSYFQKYLNWNQHDNYMGAILAELSVLTWTGLFLQPFLSYSGEIGILFISQAVCAIKYTCTYFVTSKEQFCALQGTLAGAAGLTFPVAAALKSNMVDDDEQGHIQGAVQTGKNVAGFLGTVCFGALFNMLDTNLVVGSGVDHKQTAKLIFVFGAILSLCAMPIIVTLPRDIMQQKPADNQRLPLDEQRLSVNEHPISTDDQKMLMDDERGS